MAFWILVGSFTPLISTLRFTVSPPSLSLVSTATSGTSPSWLLGHPVNTSVVYATDEVAAGAINSLVLDQFTGKLTPVGTISTQGNGPTHLGLVNNNRDIGAANFGGGSAFFASLGNDLVSFNNPQLVQFETSEALPARAHQVVPINNGALVPDLGRDQVFILAQQNGRWAIQDAIPQDLGSGPRHMTVSGNSLFVLHEKASTLTQQTVTNTDAGPVFSLAANLSIVPNDTDRSAKLAAGELLQVNNLLYASNREDPNPQGDAIAIFTTTPRLSLVAQVRTGLKHLRGVAIFGDSSEFLIAGGLNGGGIKVYRRVSAQEGFLQEIAALPETTVDQPTAFVAVPFDGVPAEIPAVGGSQIVSGTTTISGLIPIVSTSAARRRFRFGF